MATEDLNQITRALDESEAAIKAAVSGLSDEDAHSRLGGGWSALDCIEHVVVVESAFSGRIITASKAEEATVNPDREYYIRTVIPQRDRRVQARESVQPRGNYGALSEALDALHLSTEKIVTLAQEREDILRYMRLEHPILGELNGFEGFLLIAAHRQRHVNQIKEATDSQKQ